MAWVCASCNNLVDNHLPACNACGVGRSDGGGPGFAAGESAADWRDLAMEGHLKAIALWYRIGAVLSLVAVVVALAFTRSIGSAFGGDNSAISDMLGTMMIVLSVVMLVVCGGMFVLGSFLGRFANGARITAGVLTILGLGANVLRACGGVALVGAVQTYAADGAAGSMMGTVFGALLSIAWSSAMLWALFSSRSAQICTPRYREVMARTAHLRPRTFASPFFWVPFIGIALMVMLAVAGAALFVSMRSGLQ